MPESLDSTLDTRSELSREISTVVAPLLNSTAGVPEAITEANALAEPHSARYNRLMAASVLPNWKPAPW